MAKDKKTQRSSKTLPNQWEYKKGKTQPRRKHNAEIRALKHQNLDRGR